MILITSTSGQIDAFPDYIFSTQRVRFVEGDYVVIDNVQYLSASIRKINDSRVSPALLEHPPVTDLPFDGNRPVKRAGLPQINPAAISVKSFLEKYFYPFVPASIAFSGNDATFEFGTQANVNIQVRLTPNDEREIANRRIVEVSNNNQVVATGAGNDFSVSLVIKGNETSHLDNKKRVFRALADVANNGTPTTIQSGLREFNFYLPTFYGMSGALTGSTVFSSLNKTIVSEITKQFSIPLNGSNARIWFLTPYQHNKPVIKDQNGFDVTDAFVKEYLDVTTPNQHPGWSVNYVVWRSISPTTVTNRVFTVTFP